MSQQQLILQPTEVSQWFALVNEAEVALSCLLEEDIESYLVFLLMRYTSKPELISHVLALDFLRSTRSLGGKRFLQFRDLGDESLLFCGLFPGIADKRRVEIDYFIGMGKTAYANAATVEEQAADLYIALCHEFVQLKNLLHVMRKNNHHTFSKYLKTLEKHHESTGLILPGDNVNKN